MFILPVGYLTPEKYDRSGQSLGGREPCPPHSPPFAPPLIFLFIHLAIPHALSRSPCPRYLSSPVTRSH